MLSLRDLVFIGAVVALILWLFSRKAGCGCAQQLPAPAPPRAAPPRRQGCGGLAPCGGRR